MPTPETINIVVEEIFDLYVRHGADDYIGEPVSQLEHMTQSARLAEREGYTTEVILAAFFHDLGHLCAADAPQMNGFGTVNHEKIGADYLRDKGFPERLAKLVESHVQAKRYLTYKHPDYLDKLSEASRQTLQFQGGIMSRTEATDFEQDALFETIIHMRQWDELAKEENQPSTDMTYYKEMCRNYLNEWLRE